MRNETLKNLLLTASLISASAFLTACGDDAKDPAVKDNIPEIGSPTGSDDDSKNIEDADAALRQAEQNAQLQAQKDAENAKKTVVNGLQQNEENFLNFINAFNEEQLAAYKKAAANAELIKAAEARTAKEDEIISYVETNFAKLAAKPNFVFLVKRPTSLAEIATTLNAINKFQTDLTEKTTDKKKDLQDFGSGFRAKLAEQKVLSENYYDLLLKSMVAEMTPSPGRPYEISADDELELRLDRKKMELAASYVQLEKSLQSAIGGIKRRWELRERELTRLQTWKDDLIRDQAALNDDLQADRFDTIIQNTISSEPYIPTNRYPFRVLISFSETLKPFFEAKRPSLSAKTMTSTELSTALIDAMESKIIVRTTDNTEKTLLQLKTETPIDYDNYRSALLASLKQAMLNSFSPFIKDGRSFMEDEMKTFSLTAQAEAYSAETVRDISSNVSLRQARTAATGLVDGSAFKMNGVAGQSVELGMPLFIQLKGDVSSAKATEATTGSVAYRLGNTVIGAIQGYANSGTGFGTDSRQIETSVVASQSFGSFFIEGQIGTVSATDVHFSDWKGMRSQLTLGLDTEFVSPFVQVSNRQLNRGDAFDLNETTAYVGLDMNVAKLSADTYSIDTRLLAKAGYGSKDFSANAKALGSTTGFTGTVEWSASLNINSGVAFSSNLALDTTAGSSAGLTVSLDR